jgi:MSHA pilin protein MshC
MKNTDKSKRFSIAMKSKQRVHPTQFLRVRQKSTQRAFTLIELVMVIVMLGVLSVYAAPRLFNNNDFYARGFHDETMSLIRYAQKTAIAQRRTVCVSLTVLAPAMLTLSMASVDSSNVAANVCNKPVIGPQLSCLVNGLTGATGCIKARSGISYSASPATLSFDALGQPVGTFLAQAIQVANNGVAISKAITVESVTGYVHE